MAVVTVPNWMQYSLFRVILYDGMVFTCLIVISLQGMAIEFCLQESQKAFNQTLVVMVFGYSLLVHLK
jgi:hypothetical protein